MEIRGRCLYLLLTRRLPVSFSILLALSLAGCGGALFVSRHAKADYLARQAGWSYEMMAAAPFSVAAAIAPGRAGAGAPLIVYLEGDGLAFLGSHTISPDPTPNDPVGLRMALAHGNAAVAYLARPCQYAASGPCGPAYWTSHRYAPEVVASLNLATDAIKSRVGANHVILVGYSGGGALAVLMASKRSDMAGLVTVAGNLDLAAWTHIQKLTPLFGSLDPAEAAASIAAIPQVHFIGGRDDVVPNEVSQSYFRRVEPKGQAQLVVKDSFGHVCCWADDWQGLSHDPALAAIPGWRRQS